MEAWRTNIVPSYITSNPFIARSYARVVLGYLRDLQPTLDPTQPVYLLELGAGGGRFAFHFLRAFDDLLAESPLAGTRYCYILSDLPERNLAFWQEHPALREWTASGKLDFARFDAVADREIRLRHSGQVIAPGHPMNPLILLANYFFDSIPQDAFHIKDGRLQECLIKLTSPQPEPDPSDPEVLRRLTIRFITQEDDTRHYYGDPDLDAVLDRYRGLRNSYLLFPAQGMRMLRDLLPLAGGRLLLLTGDFGLTSAQEWDHNGAPDIRIHGSFSMEVNFDALGAYVQRLGGHFLAPGHPASYLTVCAFVLGAGDSHLAETRLAYAEAVSRGGPDDFFLLKRGIERNYAAWSADELLALLRFSGWDAHLFLDCYVTLQEKAPSASPRIQSELVRALERLWANYFHLGEPRDLAFSAGVLLFALGRPVEALVFFERSLQYYEPSPSTHYNAAMCHDQLRQYGRARARVKQALALDPEHEPALALYRDLEARREKYTPLRPVSD